MNLPSLIDSTVVVAFFGMGGWEVLVVGGIALLLFGNRLPSAARSLGMSFSAFKKGIQEGEQDLSDQSGQNVPAPPARDDP